MAQSRLFIIKNRIIDNIGIPYLYHSYPHRNMKTVLAIVSFILSFASIAAPTKVVFYTDSSYPPYSYIEDGQVKGVYVDLIQRVSAKLPDYHIELVASKWKDAKAKVDEGKAFGLVGAYYHAHEWPNIYPYSYPINQETVVTVCSEKTFNKESRDWPIEYNGQLVGNVAGYDGWLGGEVRSKQNTTYVNFLEVPSVELALTMVIKDRLDCTLFEESVFHWSLDKLSQSKALPNEEDQSTHITSVIAGETVHIGYSAKAIENNSYARDLIKKLDVALYKMSQTEELVDIKKGYGVQ
jgi:polar amino acid transport system substrate-binding protein